MGFIIIIALLVFALWLVKSLRGNIPQIHKCKSVKDVVMSINHGRVYPYFTGMNLERVKRIVKESNYHNTDFENSLHLQELMGNVRYVDIPIPQHALVNSVYLHVNKNKVVSSITIGISNLDFMTLVEQMGLKFGDPYSFNKQFMTWRDTCMTITLDSVNKSINVMDERLVNR